MSWRPWPVWINCLSGTFFAQELSSHGDTHTHTYAHTWRRTQTHTHTHTHTHIHTRSHTRTLVVHCGMMNEARAKNNKQKQQQTQQEKDQILHRSSLFSNKIKELQLDQTKKHSAVLFSSDPAVSSSVFVREKQENLIRNDPDKSEFSIEEQDFVTFEIQNQKKFTKWTIFCKNYPFCSLSLHLVLCLWGLCTLRHGIQNSMEAILAFHPAWPTEWLDCWLAKWCENWRIRTGPIGHTKCRQVTRVGMVSCARKAKAKAGRFLTVWVKIKVKVSYFNAGGQTGHIGRRCESRRSSNPQPFAPKALH